MTNEMIYKQMKVYLKEQFQKTGRCSTKGTYHNWNARLHTDIPAQRFASMARQGLLRVCYKVDGVNCYEFVDFGEQK